MKTEHEEQREFVSWFRQTFPGTRIFAIPNGGQRSITTAAKLKAEGVCRGVPDLFIPAWSLWVEMKRQKGGVLSEDQKDWLEYLKFNQYSCLVAKGCEDAKRQLSAFIVEHLDIECHTPNN